MNAGFIFFYDLGIQFYLLSIRILSPFNSKAKKFIEGRNGLFDEIEKKIQPNDFIVWMHCASVGEFEQGRCVIEKLKAEKEHLKVVLTFFSPSGFSIKKTSSCANYIFYMPIDTQKNAEQFIRLIHPQLAIFVKYEFWFHHLNELKKNNIPTLLISGIFRREQFFFKWFGKPFLSVLKSFNKIFAQDKKSFQILNEFGLPNAFLSTDTRFDRVIQLKNNAIAFPEIEKFCGDSKIVVAGSTWAADEKIIIQFIHDQINSSVKWIIAPHEISEKQIAALLNQLGAKAIRYSQIQNLTNEKQFLIIDNIGMLAGIYRYATIAYVGGGFGKGIHNILEAAVNGIPVLFGPNHNNFNEAIELKALKSCFCIHHETEFHSIINQLLTDKKLYDHCAEGCLSYVNNNSGATEQIVHYINQEIFKK